MTVDVLADTRRRHGTESGYRFGCRCQPCRQAAGQREAQRQPVKPPGMYATEPMAVERGEYEIVARRSGRVVGRAVRTGWGWHIPLRRRVRSGGGLERDWLAFDTAHGAELALMRMALWGGAS